MKSLFLKLVFIALLFISCSPIAYQTPGGGYRPIKPEFELINYPFQLSTTTYIDTNAVYMSKLYGTDTTQFYFYRFWGNGRVYRSDLFSDSLTNEDLNYTDGGLIGYYKLDNDSVLTTEIFYPVNTGRPILEEYGIAYGDSIIIDKEENYLYFVKRQAKKHPVTMEKLYKYKESWFSLSSAPKW